MRQTLPRVIGRCMSFSAASRFDQSLIAAVRCFYGIDVDVATAETDILEDDFERVRFFPWFLWDFDAPREDGSSAPSVGERFLAEGELTELERNIVRALVASAVAFVEVTHSAPRIGNLPAMSGAAAETDVIILRDLRTGAVMSVRDAALATELEPGQVALMRLVQLPELTLTDELCSDPKLAMLDAIYAVLPPEARPLIEDELERMLLGRDATEAQRLMKQKAPELIDFAEHVLHRLTEPPTLVNVDDQPIVLCRTLVAGELVGESAGGTEVLAMRGFTQADAGDLWVWHEDGRTIGWVRPSAGGWIVEASSRERFARLIDLLERHAVKVPALHSEEELARAVAHWLALGDSAWWLTDAEVGTAFRGQLGETLSQWPDQPHPALGRRTPREVKGEPGGDAVVERLVQRVRNVAGDAAVQRLTSLLA